MKNGRLTPRAFGPFRLPKLAILRRWAIWTSLLARLIHSCRTGLRQRMATCTATSLADSWNIRFQVCGCRLEMGLRSWRSVAVGADGVWRQLAPDIGQWVSIRL